MTTEHNSRRDFLRTAALGGLGASLAVTMGGTASGADGEGVKTITLENGMKIRSDIGTTRPRPAGQSGCCRVRSHTTAGRRPRQAARRPRWRPRRRTRRHVMGGRL